MRKVRGKPFAPGNKAAPGGARRGAGRKPDRFKVLMSDLIHQVLTTDRKKRTAAQKAFDTLCLAMDATESKGIPSEMAVDVSKYLLNFVVGPPPKQEVEHSHSGTVGHEHTVKLKPIVVKAIAGQ